MSQLTYFVVRAFYPRRATMLVGLSIALAMVSGCALARPAFKSIWQQVPQVHWANKGRDPKSKVANVEPINEPEMAANVTVKDESVDESETSRIAGSSSHRSRGITSRPRIHLNRFETPSLETRLNEDDDDGTSVDRLTEANSAGSSLERLNAALTDDSQQFQSLPQGSLTALDARVRVDLLLSQTKQLFDLGQWDEARRAAVKAQELVENAQLDLSPDEDRPVDFIRRIERQRDASRETSQPPSDDNIAEIGDTAPTPTLDPTDASNPGKSSNSPKTEKSGMARIRRDWSTLFRREKKPAAIEADSNFHTVTPSKQAMAIVLPQAEPNSHRGTAVGSLEPIVVANQSVMPGNLEELETSLASFVPEVADELPTESSSTLDRERPRLEEVEFLDDRDRQDNLTVVLAETVKPALDPDDGITSQPDFENVEPIIDVHESEPNADDTLPSELNANADDDRQTDWTAFYLGFGISSVLAIMCYRRGAT